MSATQAHNPPPNEVILEQAGKIAELLPQRAQAVIDVLTKQRELKEAKKKLERIEAKILDINLSMVEELPLFDQGRADDDDQADEDDQDEAPAAEKPDESWRMVPVGTLDEFGLAQGVIAKLKDAGLYCVGSIADWTKSKKLTDVPGIGEAKADAIESALAGFWEARRTEERHLAGELGRKVEKPAVEVVEEKPDGGIPAGAGGATRMDRPGVTPDWRDFPLASLDVSDSMKVVLSNDVGETLRDLRDWLADGNAIDGLEWGVDVEMKERHVDGDDHKRLADALRATLDGLAVPEADFSREWIGCHLDIYRLEFAKKKGKPARPVYLMARSLTYALAAAEERYKDCKAVSLHEGPLPDGETAETLPLLWEPHKDRYDRWKVENYTGTLIEGGR